MLDQNDLQAIAQLMDAKLEKQRDEMLEVMQQQMETTQAMIYDSEQRIKIYVENNICKRIDSLFDGYKLAHEKQSELEGKVEKLEKRVEVLEDRAG